MSATQQPSTWARHAAQLRETRSPFHGLRQIVRFNWPFYVVALASIAVVTLLIILLPLPRLARAVLSLVVGVAAFWTAGSLLASWMVYDRSALSQGRWIAPLLAPHGRSLIVIHSGFDEISSVLRTRLTGWRVRALDIFDPVEMNEPSIRRARRFAAPEIAAQPADYRNLPMLSESADAVVVFLSAHELRNHRARVALFSEIHRVVSTSGRVIVAEHLRDVPNFIAFGPGFMHFHSRRTWLRSFAHAGLAIQQEFSITPFVRIFVLWRSA